MNDDFITKVTKYLKENEISFTINKNPSLEDMERINSYIKKGEELEKLFRERFKIKKK